MNLPKDNDGGRLAVSGAATLISRRPLLGGLAASLVLRALPAFAHGKIGRVKPPIAVPDIIVITSDGFHGPLRERLRGRVTAVQLMFSQCRSICPIEAATFVRTQEALASYPADDIQLLSLSIDPATDTPDVLNAWLKSFDAGSRWTAAAPAGIDLARARQFFDGGSSLGEDHSTAMSLVDRDGMLVWRTAELPAPDDVAKTLEHLQKASRTDG